MYAIASVMDLSSTDTQVEPVIRLIHFNDFRSMTEFPRFPKNADLARPLRTVDVDNSFIVFISHCWLRGWSGAEGYTGRPHPDNAKNEKFLLCLSGIEKMIENFAFQLQNCYVWLDFGCINQNSDPAGELKQLDEIVRYSDCIFTPIVDNDDWDLVHTAEGFFVDYKAKAWNAEVYGYLNRGWCRLEMFYAANIPVRASPKENLFTAGLKFAAKAGRRPHVLYGSREERNDSQPIVLDPLQNSFFEKYHPMKGCLSVKDDCVKIQSLVEVLLPYMTFSLSRYDGEHDASDRRHGRGTLTFDDGNRYTGDFKAGAMCGVGEYIFSNGDRYNGDFFNNHRHGFGVFSFANGNTYSGDFLLGKYNGFGTYTFANGDVYCGEWREGRKHGYGVFSCVSGFNYDGGWQHDKRDGFAVFTSSNGDIYTGDFRDNVEEGLGVYNSTGGDRYEGQFVAGKKHGFGFFSYSDGDKYEGDFDNDRAQGKGRFRYFNGDTYEGSLVNGCYEGYGEYTYADGRKYLGAYRGNLKHGFGIFYFGNNEDRIECYFEDDKCNGAAVCVVDGVKRCFSLKLTDVSTIISDFYPKAGEDELSSADKKLKPLRTTLKRLPSISTASTRTLVETTKGLRYYCHVPINESNQFHEGGQRWCTVPGHCTCTLFCGPVSGCQCTDCYQMTYPSVSPSDRRCDVETDDHHPASEARLSTSATMPSVARNWGRLRKAVLTRKEDNTGVCEDLLPLPPPLLATRSNRMPSSANLITGGKISSSKVHRATVLPNEHQLPFGEPHVTLVSTAVIADSDSSIFCLDADDLPPPPPPLVSTKSRSSYGHNNAGPFADSTIGLSHSLFVGSSTDKNFEENVKEVDVISGDCDAFKMDHLPPSVSNLSAWASTDCISVPGRGLPRASSAKCINLRRASNAHFDIGVGYTGGMKNGFFDGYGKLVYRGGAEYAGSFADGQRCGTGKFSYSVHSSYEGSYSKNLKHGTGKMEFLNGSSYMGDFMDDMRHGRGFFCYASGGFYNGSYKAGLFDGEGVHESPDGNEYEGFFLNGRRHGKGIFTFKCSGCSFSGEFWEGILVSGTATTTKGVQRTFGFPRSTLKI